MERFLISQLARRLAQQKQRSSAAAHAHAHDVCCGITRPGADPHVTVCASQTLQLPLQRHLSQHEDRSRSNTLPGDSSGQAFSGRTYTSIGASPLPALAGSQSQYSHRSTITALPSRDEHPAEIDRACSERRRRGQPNEVVYVLLLKGSQLPCHGGYLEVSSIRFRNGCQGE